MRHGFLFIDKPLGLTSHDVVARVRRSLGERDIGHLGTLDPAASGLLVLAVGKKALKIIELFTDLSKEYEADVQLGAVSTTYDRDGVIEEVVRKPGVEIPDDMAIRLLIADRFIGRISQVPPAHSAIKIGGERAYRMARRGDSIEMPSRLVDIHACTIVSYAYPQLQLRVRCGSGTYIRSLANDLGDLLHCGGYLAGLRRTKVGDWSVESAHSIDDAAWADVIPLKEILPSFPRMELSTADLAEAGFGRLIDQSITETTIGWHEDLPVAVLEPKDGKAHARKVL